MQGSEVKAIRLALGASHTELSRALGIHRANIYRWETKGIDGLPETVMILLRDHPRVWKWLNARK